jgi:site-specific recombinase
LTQPFLYSAIRGPLNPEYFGRPFILLPSSFFLHPCAVVAFSLKALMDRYAGRHAALPSLDVLASSASPAQSLEERLNWLVDLAQWIRRPGHEEEAPSANMSLQSGRLRRLLDVLERNPEWKLAVARTLRSIIRETRAVSLFSETGLPRQSGLLTEMSERLARKFLPAQPGSAELGPLFERLFPFAGDDVWIENLDEAALERFGALLEHEVGPDEKDWNKLFEELEDALAYLAAQIRVTGCSGGIRRLLKHQSVRELAFFKLAGALSGAFAASEKGDEAALAAELNHLQSLLDGCHRDRAEALEHLEKSGVSTEVVYHLAFIEASLQRFQELLVLAFDPAAQLRHSAGFVALLARQTRARESVTDLLRQNWRLLTRKIVERSGETGEHYIARTRQEYGAMLKSAAGGGAIMAVTAWLKTILLAWGLPGLMQGVAASLNYALGFVVIQLTGSTLATKQPANTAPALAARMHNVREPAAVGQLVDEIVFLVRSQIASIAGNLALVVPSMLALHFLILYLTGKEIMPAAKAAKAVEAVSILGPSAFYGAFTGALLWASSLAAGWAGNWFACHHIGEALAADRRLIRVLGTTRAARLARFWTRNVGGLAGNISFGFMLGLIPEAAAFAGLPLDVRHVTLSSCFLTASMATLGVRALATKAFVLAALGIAAIGLMNLAVSFSLAMFVAIRACDIQQPERHKIYRAVARRALRHPLSFLCPPRSDH